MNSVLVPDSTHGESRLNRITESGNADHRAAVAPDIKVATSEALNSAGAFTPILARRFAPPRRTAPPFMSIGNGPRTFTLGALSGDERLPVIDDEAIHTNGSNCPAIGTSGAFRHARTTRERSCLSHCPRRRVVPMRDLARRNVAIRASEIGSSPPALVRDRASARGGPRICL